MLNSMSFFSLRWISCVKKITCAESAVLTITERVFSLYTLDTQWEAMKELNRLL